MNEPFENEFKERLRYMGYDTDDPRVRIPLRVCCLALEGSLTALKRQVGRVASLAIKQRHKGQLDLLRGYLAGLYGALPGTCWPLDEETS